jgi:hypothetical protein
MTGKADRKALLGTGKFPVFHRVHRGVDIRRKKLFGRLDIYGEHGRIANGSALPKSAAPCRGFTVGSELLQRVDPIVRSLISTG